MTGQQVGYIRVSSSEQNTSRQLEGVSLDKIFTDKVSGGSLKDRAQIEACIDYLREGDNLYVHSIDRLARNLRDLQDIVTRLTDKGVTVKFKTENLTFSNDKNNAIATMTMQIMGSFAEFERSMIRSRQRVGIDAAKAAGVALGRRPKLNDPELIARAKKMKANGMKKTEISKELGLSRPSVDRLLAS